MEWDPVTDPLEHVYYHARVSQWIISMATVKHKSQDDRQGRQGAGAYKERIATQV